MSEQDDINHTVVNLIDGFKKNSAKHNLELYIEWLKTRDFVALLRPEVPISFAQSNLATRNETRKKIAKRSQEYHKGVEAGIDDYFDKQGDRIVRAYLEAKVVEGETEVTMELAVLKDELAQAKADLAKKSSSFPWRYVVFLIIFLFALCGCIVGTYYATVGLQVDSKQLTITVEYSVGEIIGAILAGLGVAVAGGAYALKTLREVKPEIE